MASKTETERGSAEAEEEERRSVQCQTGNALDENVR
jgi:hypothetical protein